MKNQAPLTPKMLYDYISIFLGDLTPSKDDDGVELIMEYKTKYFASYINLDDENYCKVSDEAIDIVTRVLQYMVTIGKLSSYYEYSNFNYSEGSPINYFTVCEKPSNPQKSVVQLPPKLKELKMSTTQQVKIQSAKNRNYIIGSIREDGCMSISENPQIHINLEKAMAESTRLARLNPGRAYVVFQMVGGSYIPPNVPVHF